MARTSIQQLADALSDYRRSTTPDDRPAVVLDDSFVAVVREGVREGLADYEEVVREEGTDVGTDGTSASGRSAGRLLGGAALLAALAYVARRRRRRRTDETDVQRTVSVEPDDESRVDADADT